jgi:hypothetical protein
MAKSDQSTQYIHKEIDRTAMSEVLDLGDVLELIADRFEVRGLPQQQMFRKRHQAVLS